MCIRGSNTCILSSFFMSFTRLNAAFFFTFLISSTSRTYGLLPCSTLSLPPFSLSESMHQSFIRSTLHNFLPPFLETLLGVCLMVTLANSNHWVSGRILRRYQLSCDIYESRKYLKVSRVAVNVMSLLLFRRRLNTTWSYWWTTEGISSMGRMSFSPSSSRLDIKAYAVGTSLRHSRKIFYVPRR